MSIAIALLAGVGSAIAYGAGTAGQHAEAYTGTGHTDAGRLADLLRSPRWLASTAGDGVGVLLQIIALSNGPVVLVQPLLVLALPVAVALRAAFGGPNYTTTFTEDITPSPQKILLWRKMAYQVCLDAVARDAGKATRLVFTEVDPAQPISTSNAAVNAQIDGLYQRFFLEAPSAQESTRAAGLLAAAFADGSDPKEAWRALCVGYLASMKFLSY